MLADVLHFIEFIFVFALALIALFIVLLIVVSMMPSTNPKMILAAFAHRVGATAGLMMLDPVATTVPVAGEIWDLATMMWLIYFWYTFLKQLPAMREAWSDSAKHNPLRSRPTRVRPSQTFKTPNNQQSVPGKRAPSTIGWKPGMPPVMTKVALLGSKREETPR
jgi:hypothetical protein